MRSEYGIFVIKTAHCDKLLLSLLLLLIRAEIVGTKP